MKRTSVAMAVMAATVTAAAIKSWSVAEISPSLYAPNSYPVSGRRTGIAAAKRAAKKRRRTRHG